MRLKRSIELCNVKFVRNLFDFVRPYGLFVNIITDNKVKSISILIELFLPFVRVTRLRRYKKFYRQVEMLSPAYEFWL